MILKTGQTFTTRGITITEGQIVDFGLTYDPQPFHIDREAAAQTPFGGLIASGFQTVALAFRMFYQENVINACAIGSPGMDELRWRLPVRPNDTLTTEAEVLSLKASRSKPDRGFSRVAFHGTQSTGRKGDELSLHHYPAPPPCRSLNPNLCSKKLVFRPLASQRRCPVAGPPSAHKARPGPKDPHGALVRPRAHDRARQSNRHRGRLTGDGQ